MESHREGLAGKVVVLTRRRVSYGSIYKYISMVLVYIYAQARGALLQWWFRAPELLGGGKVTEKALVVIESAGTARKWKSHQESLASK